MEIEAMLSGEFLRDTAKYISMHAYMYVTYTCIYVYKKLNVTCSLAFACLESNVCMLLTCTNLTLRRSEVRVGVCFHLRIWISVVISGALSSHPRLHLITECISSYVHMYILYIRTYIHTSRFRI